jgi:hypothetical protein
MRWGSDRTLLAIGAATLALTAYWFPPVGSAQPDNPTIVGQWVLDTALSDRPPQPAARQGGGFGRGGGRRGGGGFGGGGFGGGFGGGGFGGRGGFDGPRGGDRGGAGSDDARSEFEALRSVIDAPARLTIVSADSMVIITTGDGLTTRLAPDGSKVKDESTHTERKTHWDGHALVSEITGLGKGTVTQTYSVDADGKRLLVTVQAPDARAGPNGRGLVVHQVYDAAS